MKWQSTSIKLMGTTIDLKILSNDECVLDKVIKKLNEYNHIFSANDESSVLMQINHNAGIRAIAVDPILYDLIRIGKKHSLSEDSSMNIAIGPLVQLWRIGFDDVTIPSDQEIQEVLKLCDPKAIELNDKTHEVFLKHQGMKIDLGCIAKGYIADLIINDLKEKGAQAGMINLGGNVLTFGNAENRSDGYWRIGIKDPNQKDAPYKGILKIKDESIVTSGIAERNYQDYHHIFDRKTGYPIKNTIASISIIAPDSLDAEIYTTKYYGAKPEQILKKIQELDGCEAIIIEQDGSMLLSRKDLLQ